MRYGVTPFQLSAEIWSALSDIGIEPIPWDLSSIRDSEVALLYDSPDQLIAMAAVGFTDEESKPNRLVQGYRSLLARSEHTLQPLFVISHLLRRGQQGHAHATAAEDIPSAGSSLSAIEEPAVSPELAACVLILLEAEPALLEAYQDLELRAELLGREPDLRYRERLRKVAHNGEALLRSYRFNQRTLAASVERERRLAELQECLSEKDRAWQESRQDAELTRMQLQQVHDELEKVFLADREKQRQLEITVQDLEALRSLHETRQIRQDQELVSMHEAYQTRLAGLEECLADKEAALHESSEEAELTLLQLHQVQNELEQTFLADREKQRLLEASVQEMNALRVLHESSRIGQAQELESEGQAFEKRMTELQEQLAEKESALQESREEAELTLRQLHQVQEELEHYFLESRAIGQLATAQAELLKRSQSIFNRLQPGLTITPQKPVAVNVEVLAGRAEIDTGKSSLQTEALLKTYASSLERASALLERARHRKR